MASRAGWAGALLAGALMVAPASGQAETIKCPKKARKARLSKNQTALTKQAWKDIDVRHYRRAAKRFRRALKSFPGNAPAWHGLGRALLFQGKSRMAEPPLKCALKLDDSDPALYLDLMAALKKNHNSRKARKLHRKMRKRHPDVDRRELIASVPKDVRRTVAYD